jgi:hypothetical protein
MVALFWLMVLFSAIGEAAEASIELAHSELQVGQSVGLDLVVSGLDIREPPVLQVGDGLSVSYQSRQSSTELSLGSGGGNAVRSTRFSYLLRAGKSGRWKIGPLLPSSGNAAIDVAVKYVEVHPRSAASLAESSAEARLSSSFPYSGEALVYRFRYRHRSKNVGEDWSPPTFEGLGGFPGMDREQKNYVLQEEGETVKVLDVMVPLIAGDPGAFRVSESRIAVKVPTGKRSSRGVFSLFEMVESDQREYSTSPIAGQVRPLPPAPSGFSGLVGSFTLRAEPSTRELPVGDSLTIMLVLEGQGSLGGFRFPAASQAGLKFYDDSPQRQTLLKDGKPWSRVVLSRAVVPLVEGRQLLEPVSLLVFDPEIEDYQRLQTEPVSLLVGPGGSDEVGLASFHSEETAELADIRSPPMDTKISDHRSTALWPVFLLPFAPLAAVFWRRKASAPAVSPPKWPAALPEEEGARMAALRTLLDQAVAYRVAADVRTLGAGDYARAGEQALELHQAIDRSRFGGFVHEGLEESLRTYIGSIQ